MAKRDEDTAGSTAGAKRTRSTNRTRAATATSTTATAPAGGYPDKYSMRLQMPGDDPVVRAFAEAQGPRSLSPAIRHLIHMWVNEFGPVSVVDLVLAGVTVPRVRSDVEAGTAAGVAAGTGVAGVAGVAGAGTGLAPQASWPEAGPAGPGEQSPGRDDDDDDEHDGQGVLADQHLSEPEQRVPAAPPAPSAHDSTFGIPGMEDDSDFGQEYLAEPESAPAVSTAPPVPVGRTGTGPRRAADRAEDVFRGR